MDMDSGQTILCPVDFGDVSAHALRQAASIAKCTGARIVALHASSFEAPPYFTEAQFRLLRDELRRSLSEGRRSLEAFAAAALGAKAPAVEAVVVEGVAADAILAQSRSAGTRMIVMGTHGRSGWNRWMLGSVTERVLRESAVPVLTVRGKAPERIANVLCPVSNNEESRRALAEAVALAACFDATVTVLHVDEPHGGGASIPDLCSWVPAEARARCMVREFKLNGDAAEEIVRVTTSGTYDVVVLGAPRRRFFEGMVLGTTAIRVVRHAGCPVLSVPAGA